jgi:hypothetical protein
MWRDPRVGDRVKFIDDEPTHPNYRNKEGVVEEINEDYETAFVRLDDPVEPMCLGCDWDQLEILF